MHPGSWFGLPDLGITEDIGRFLGKGTTSQGGSDIIPNAPSFSVTPQQLKNSFAQPTSSGGQVLSSSISSGTGGTTTTPSTTTTSTTNTGTTTDPYASIKADIGNAWDNYISGLNDTANTFLPQQATAQNKISNDQYNQGVSDINSQKASSLKDIGNNIKNAFQAGNIYLGSRGAGDSSAANQYSFAINQEAGKQTSQLNDFVNTQINQLSSTHDQQLNSIASWLAQQQAAVKNAINQGQLSKATDINNLSKSLLDQAMQAANQVKQNASDQYNALLQWAANNSTNIGQLKSNIAAIPQAAGNVQIDSQGNFVVPVGYGYGDYTSKQAQPLFQNSILTQ